LKDAPKILKIRLTRPLTQIKDFAATGARRISEGTLPRLAFLGAAPGAYAGRAVFRHKPRKQPFCGNLRAIAVLQIIVAAATIAYHRLA